MPEIHLHWQMSLMTKYHLLGRELSHHCPWLSRVGYHSSRSQPQHDFSSLLEQPSCSRLRSGNLGLQKCLSTCKRQEEGFLYLFKFGGGKWAYLSSIQCLIVIIPFDSGPFPRPTAWARSCLRHQRSRRRRGLPRRHTCLIYLEARTQLSALFSCGGTAGGKIGLISASKPGFFFIGISIRLDCAGGKNKPKYIGCFCSRCLGWG